MSDDPVVGALRAAIAAQPGVVELRVHLVEVLVSRGQFAEALAECGAALGVAPGNPRLLELLAAAAAGLGAPAAPGPAPADAGPPKPAVPPASGGGFDWEAARDEVSRDLDPDLVDALGGDPEPLGGDDYDALDRPSVRLSDIGGMSEVKRQLDVTLFGPLRNPELARAYQTSARGGLLLYGPPGCGKSFLATAVAGELGARFYRIGISDVLGRWLGESERALHDVFETARFNAPCVVFVDELDALGHRRGALSGASGLRTVVNSLLMEMDSGTSQNDGVYLLGATNHPWDVDPALRRPGRFDRMILVTPPDLEARAAILGYHLRDRPVVGVDLPALAKKTEGFTGADLMHLANLATQYAMTASVQSGRVEPVTSRELEAARRQIRPSATSWFEQARSVLQFGNNDGSYDDLADYLRKRRR